MKSVDELSGREVDALIIRIRKALWAWHLSTDPDAAAVIKTQIGLLKHLLDRAPPEKRPKIQALIAHFSPDRHLSQ
ncbi:hypothetical protein XM25_07730 [Devosia sp. H5989]|nr:hypothetical protein XM25_07730 [Devosia sp. H5989]